MFWDNWSDSDWKIYSIFLCLGVLSLWNIILTIYLILVGRRNGKVEKAEIISERIATSPLWNQMYVPKIPRLPNSKGTASNNSSIPQTPSDWFGDGPARMENNRFF